MATSRGYRASTPPPEKRSLEGTLWVLGAVVFIGYPILRDATADRMRRNVYRSMDDCVCAYEARHCRVDVGGVYGPWYAAVPAERRIDDPGSGQSCDVQAGSGGYGSYRYPRSPAPVRVEHGYRGGFGSFGGVRSASS